MSNNNTNWSRYLWRSSWPSWFLFRMCLATVHLGPANRHSACLNIAASNKRKQIVSLSLLILFSVGECIVSSFPNAYILSNCHEWISRWPPIPRHLHCAPCPWCLPHNTAKMRFSVSTLVVMSLAALSGTAAGMGMSGTAFEREIAFAAQMGISPDVLWSQHKNTHRSAMGRVFQNYTSESITV